MLIDISGIADHLPFGRIIALTLLLVLFRKAVAAITSDESPLETA
jgi:hypothetical protein